MNLWMYLVGKMRVYGNRIAFPELNMTYSDILAFPTGKDIGKLRICEAKTRAEQAVEILKSIAAGTVSVPVTHEYGESRYQMICRTIDNDITGKISPVLHSFNNSSFPFSFKTYLPIFHGATPPPLCCKT